MRRECWHTVSMLLFDLTVATIGHRVAGRQQDARVHSVFAQACNFERHGSLFTLVAPRAGAGPAALVLAHEPGKDLRTLFETGERVEWRADAVRTRRVALHLETATTWSPLARRALLGPDAIAARSAWCAARLAASRRQRSSVIDRQGAAAVCALAQAGRILDLDEAIRCAGQLVGWGEGLTPAGDDVLIGWLAGLRTLAVGDRSRQDFLNRVGAAIAQFGARTTPIAAHYLRLAADGDCDAALDVLRDALFCATSHGALAGALERALAVGATSGADAVTGLLAAARTWPMADEPALH
jgi:hypothetical protein